MSLIADGERRAEEDQDGEGKGKKINGVRIPSLVRVF